MISPPCFNASSQTLHQTLEICKSKTDENRKLIPERSAELWHFENDKVSNPQFPLFQNVIGFFQAEF